MPLQRVLAGIGAVLLLAIGVSTASGAAGPTTDELTTAPPPTASTTTDAGTTTEPPATSTHAPTTTPTPTTTMPVSTAVSPRLLRHAITLTLTPMTVASAAKAKHVKRKHKKHKPTREPLKVTPPLALKHYVFPVVGRADYGDTYGAYRGDVPGNWHHGDDIFAALGTPVVAVSAGTINRVGWEKLGGWRLWVRDPYGDTFYYAHLSGYVASDLRSNVVKKGQVLGFIGNTGDAFTTSPHLHFEIHPWQLQRLHYDGAVDPTTYLNSWPHLDHVHIPLPVHPPLPHQPLLRREATFVFRELLAARGLIKHAPRPSLRPQVLLPLDGAEMAAAPPILQAAHRAIEEHGSRSGLLTAGLAGVAALGGFAAVAALPRVRRRWRGNHAQP
jgi:murein DD-endopeptidase MepM/ murein hydrolase activator NlpD